MEIVGGVSGSGNDGGRVVWPIWLGVGAQRVMTLACWRGAARFYMTTVGASAYRGRRAGVVDSAVGLILHHAARWVVTAGRVCGRGGGSLLWR